MRRFLSMLCLLVAFRLPAFDYDAAIDYFTKEDVKEAAEDLFMSQERINMFFDASRLSDEVYLPDRNIAQVFKYLFWAFEHQKYWIKIYPFKQLDLENPEPTCFMIIFEMNF